MDDHHGLRPLSGQRQVVGDQQQRGPEFRGKPLEVVQHPPLDRDVKRRRRLVGDEQLRPSGQADRDQRALTHAAGKLMGILGGLPHGIRHARLGEQLERAPSRIATRSVGPQRFPDLKPHLPDRVEVGHRILRDVADVAAPDRPQHPAVSSGDVEPVEDDATGRDSSAGWQQPEDRGGRGGFPGPGFADHRDGLTAPHRQIHATHHGPIPETDLEALDRQQRLAGIHARRPREAGSNASRRASPIIMKASTVMASAPAG